MRNWGVYTKFLLVFQASMRDKDELKGIRTGGIQNTFDTEELRRNF